MENSPKTVLCERASSCSKSLSDCQRVAFSELEEDYLERRNQGSSLFSFCSGDRLDGQWVDSREDDGGAIGRTADRMAGGEKRPFEILALQLVSSSNVLEGIGSKGERTLPD